MKAASKILAKLIDIWDWYADKKESRRIGKRNAAIERARDFLHKDRS